jgi:hypothetical protein
MSRVAPQLQSNHFPWRDRPITVTIRRARELSGLGNTKIWELIKEKRLEVVRIDRRTLVRMNSLEKLLTD